MEEIWKDIVGYEGRYQVSNKGRVKSKCYHNGTDERILKIRKNQSGYSIVNLYDGKNTAGKLKTVHRLVAQTFLPNPKSYPVINHKDENPQNNNVNNLEWCDSKYNVNYSVKLHPERKIKRYGQKRRPYKLDKQVLQKTLDGTLVERYENASKVTQQKGYNQWSITQCCDGKRKTAYGFIWQYAN